MPYEIKRQESTGLFIVVDTNTGKTLSRADQPSDAINIAIANGTLPADDKQGLLTEARVVVEKENEVQQQKSTAYQTAVDDAAKGPNAPAAQQLGPDGRVTLQPDTTSPSNATKTATIDSGGGDSGTDATTRPTTQTQATGPASNTGQAVAAPNFAFGQDAAQLAEARLLTNPGTPTNDDAKDKSAAANQAAQEDDYTNIKIVPRANPLDNYYSYTYSISVYMLTNKQYEILLNSKNKKIDGYFLLFQSGGAGVNKEGKPKTGMGEALPNGGDSGRNPFFGDDFYIDSFSLTTYPLGGATGASQSATEMKMTVVEPQGMTLTDRLYKAAENLEPKDGAGVVNYTAVTYLAVIRFYGYDEAGNISYPIRSMGEASGTTDPKAVIEKFVPFIIKGINWTVGSKTVTYDWDCGAIGQFVGVGRGEIPADVQLVDSTVAGVLGGTVAADASDNRFSRQGTANTDQSAAESARLASKEAALSRSNRENARSVARIARQGSAPSNASAAPTANKTITNDLVTAMNEFQRSQVDRGIIQIADEYSIEFKSDVPGVPASKIADATLKPIGQVRDDKKMTAGGQQAEQDTQSLNQETNTVDPVSQSMSITAGQNMTQVIELVIRNSSYIQDQQLIIVNTDGTWTPNPNSRNKPVSWYIINMFATQKDMDPLRGDYAYKIKYVVQPFIPQNLISKYFPVSKFNGIHKKYPYWFTGQNVAVIEYKENLNGLYTLTVSGNDPKNSADAGLKQNYASRLSDIVQYNQTDTIKFQYSPRSNQPSAGQTGKKLEPGANAADYLLSPATLREVQVRIIGDPDWIQQGNLFKDIKQGENKVAARTGFGEDGSISFESTDVLFEMLWQRPEDYNIDTGLADPYSGGYSGNANGTREAVQSKVYKATKVVSEFKGGKFEQALTGAIYLFPKPQDDDVFSRSSAINPTAAARVLRQGATPSAATNQTVDTRARTGLDLSSDAAVQGNNLTDPRSFQSADGGKATILGAQGSYNNVGVGQFASRATIEPGALAALGPTLLPAGPPRPATSGTGGIIGTVPDTVGSGPPKLPQVLSGQTNLSITQIAGQLVQSAAGPRRGAVPGATGGPSTQQIVKDR